MTTFYSCSVNPRYFLSVYTVYILRPSDTKLPFVHIWVTNAFSEYPVWCELPSTEVWVVLLVFKVLTANSLSLKETLKIMKLQRNASELHTISVLHTSCNSITPEFTRVWFFLMCNSLMLLCALIGKVIEFGLIGYSFQGDPLPNDVF